MLSEAEEFYKVALQYVAYTPLDTLPKQEVVGLAFDLGIAALLGENIFNFGDLVHFGVLCHRLTVVVGASTYGGSSRN